MYSPYVSWYQVPKGYSKPKPFTEMFTQVKKTNIKTVYENIQYFPVALFVKCGCDFQKKLMLDRELQTHDIKLFSLPNCDNNEVMPEPLDLSVKSIMKNRESIIDNYDLNGKNCQGLELSTNIASDDNKENRLSSVSSLENPRVQNVQKRGSSSHQLSEQRIDDVVAYDNNAHSLPVKEDIQTINVKAVERINIKQLNRKITKRRRRWSAKSSDVINISKIVVSSLISSVKLQLFPRKRRKPPYRALRETEKKSVRCQTTWEIERNIEVSSRSVSLHPTCLETQEAYYSNDDPPSIEVLEVTPEIILSSSHDPLLSNNTSKIGQESYCSNSNTSSSDGFSNMQCKGLDKCPDRPKESSPDLSSVKPLIREKEMPSQDFPVLMDFDNFSTDKLLDLLSVEHDVFGNIPNELESFGLYYPQPNCGISQVEDEDMYISNAYIKYRDQEEFMIKRENKDSNSAVEKKQSSISTVESEVNPLSVVNACDKYQSPIIESDLKAAEQICNDTVELPRAGLKSGLQEDDTVLISNLSTLDKSGLEDENNNYRPVPSEKFYGRSKKTVKNDNLTAEKEKNIAEKVVSSATDSIYRKHLSRKRRGGTLGNDKRNKRSRNSTDFVKNSTQLPSKANRKPQQKISLLKKGDPKKREAKTPRSFFRKYHRLTRSSSERRTAFGFCEKNNNLASLGNTEWFDETEDILEKKSPIHNRVPSEHTSNIKKDATKNNDPSLKIKIPLSSLNAASSTNDIVGKIIQESTAKRIEPPTLSRSRNPHLTTKQKNKVQPKSSIDFTFLPDYVPVLLKNTCPSLTPVHEPFYNFPSQNVHVTVPIERKKPPVIKPGNSLLRDPRLKSRKRKNDQEDEEKARLDLLTKKQTIHANNDETKYPNVSVSKEDLERNTFLITEILRDASYGICASFGIALFDSKGAHQCPEMDTNTEHPEKNMPLYNELELVSK